MNQNFTNHSALSSKITVASRKMQIPKAGQYAVVYSGLYKDKND